MASTKSRRGSRRAELIDALMAAAPRMVTDAILLHQAIADRLGLHITDLRCLQILTATGPTTPGELVKRTGLTTGAVTRLVDRLVTAGYLRRTHDTTDRRRVIITPVVEKCAPIGTLYSGLARGWNEVIARYTDQELELILDLFERLHPISLREIEKLRK